MKKISRVQYLILAMVTLTFAALTSISYANHSWGNYHWARTTSSFTLQLGDNLTSAWDDYLVTASDDWNRGSSSLDTVIVPGGSNPKNCRPTAGRVEVCNAKYGNNGWLGIAQIWASGSHITQGVVKLNDTYYASARYNTPAWRLMVASQEIGHTFGLDHQDETFNNYNLGTCMDYTNAPAGGIYNGFNYGPSNEHPNNHDFYQLDQVIYAHTDNTTTVGQATANSNMPPAMNDMDFSGPGQWGKLVRSTNDGLTELYELDFGGGHKIFTFVVWTEEARGRGNRQK